MVGNGFLLMLRLTSCSTTGMVDGELSYETKAIFNASIILNDEETSITIERGDYQRVASYSSFHFTNTPVVR